MKRNEFDCACFTVVLFGRPVVIHVDGRCSCQLTREERVRILRRPEPAVAAP